MKKPWLILSMKNRPLSTERAKLLRVNFEELSLHAAHNGFLIETERDANKYLCGLIYDPYFEARHINPNLVLRGIHLPYAVEKIVCHYDNKTAAMLEKQYFMGINGNFEYFKKFINQCYSKNISIVSGLEALNSSREFIEIFTDYNGH